MPELEDELQRLADQAGQHAHPMPPAEVMRRGERRRHRRMVTDAVAALAVGGAITAAVVSGTAPGQHTAPQRPQTGYSTPLPSPSRRQPVSAPSPAPSRRSPVPTPSPGRSQLAPAVSRTPNPRAPAPTLRPSGP